MMGRGIIRMAMVVPKGWLMSKAGFRSQGIRVFRRGKNGKNTVGVRPMG